MRFEAFATLVSLTAINCRKGGKTKDTNSTEFIPIQLPSPPYDQTAFFVDYGMTLESYPAISNTSLRVDNLKSFIHYMTVPINDYIESTTDEKVTEGARKESLLGMIDFLAKNESFHLEDITTDSWKASKIQGAVIKRESLVEVIKRRNSIFQGITNPQTRSQVVHRYQQGLKQYQNVLSSLDESDFSSLIGNHAIEWDLYEARYGEMLKLVKQDPTKFSPLVRNFFASWLRDGNQNDEMYRDIKEKAYTGRMFQLSGASLLNPTWVAISALLGISLTILLNF